MDHPDRTVLVAYERLPGWVERFGDRHGEVAQQRDGAHVRLTAADGAVAEYDDIAPPARFGLVLVRRGGYAIGLAEGSTMVATKCGTRYVQGRTKAGGRSQQRYARRRANQADDLAGAAAAAIARVLTVPDPPTVFGGGDRALVLRALETSRTGLAPADRWLDVGEPRRATLDAAAKQARSIPIALNELA